MGCQQSTALVGDPSFESASLKQPAFTSGATGTAVKKQSTGLSSTELNATSFEDLSDYMPRVDDNGNLMAEEIVRRTSSSLFVSSVLVGGNEKGKKPVEVKYAYRSQRGYNPGAPRKANQDTFDVMLNLAGESGDTFFAVYDGHGEAGHHCANYAKKKLPQALAKFVRQKRVQRYAEQRRAEGSTSKQHWNQKMWPLLGVVDFESCCKSSVLETNKSMHEDLTLDDKLSGTTAAAVCFHGGRMTVCNVGDSRVILGHRVTVHDPTDSREEEKCTIDEEAQIRPRDDHILAIPLTRDQTPYRNDERDRIRLAGGEIRSIDQKDGHVPTHENWGDMVLGEAIDVHGDPPRVWVPNKSYPGCTFTRSLGDSMAEDIGVNADPEIITRDLTVNDEILVIATDGVTEFLTNQEIINMCLASSTPLEACEAVTTASYIKWTEHDRRSDDITIIVCFLSSTFLPTSPDEISNSTYELVNSLDSAYGTEMAALVSKPPSRATMTNPMVSEVYAIGGRASG